MAASGYTPISLYYSSTASATPTAGNLVNGELAINITDGKLYYKDNGGTVKVIAGTGGTGVVAGSNTQVQFNNNGVFGASSAFTWDGTTMSATRVATSQVNITGQGDLRLEDTTGGEYVALQAPATLSASYTLTMPADDGTNGQALITDGNGNLSWSTAASGDVYGPASSTANGIALFDGTTGKLLKDSASTDGLIHGLTVGRGGSSVASNTALGYQALLANSTGSNNTALGYQAGLANVSGNLNTFIGRFSASNGNVSGSENVGIGNSSLYTLTSGQCNAAVGSGSMVSATTAQNNAVLGYQALNQSVSGNNNAAVGYQALFSNTNSNNTAVGYQAGYSNTTGTYSTFIGWGAGYTNTTGQLTAVGAQALNKNTTGTSNAATGVNALFANTTGNYNSAFGEAALQNNTTASYNTAVGYQAAYTNTTGSELTAVGYGALQFNSTGNYSTAVGLYALRQNTTGANNVAIGDTALYSNTTSSNNTAVGYQSLYTNTAQGNNAFGSQALYANTSGTFNYAFGGGVSGVFGASLQSNTTGSYNAAFGCALGGNTTGSYNTALGHAALAANTTASNNTAVGYQAGYSVTTGQYNVLIGENTGRSLTVGGSSTMVGEQAGYYTTGANNTFLGQGAGYYVTTGTKNTVLGSYTGNQGGLDIRTASNYIVLSDGDGNPRGIFDGNGHLGVGVVPSPTSWFCVPGGSGTYAHMNGGNSADDGVAPWLASWNSTAGSSATFGWAFYNSDSDGNLRLYRRINSTTGNLVFTANRSNGNVTFNNNISVGAATPTTSGTGITFPATQNASSDANTLDDYEEGTVTLKVSDGTNLTSGATCWYVKVGGVCTVTFDLYNQNTSGLNTSAIRITGLPFNAAVTTTNSSIVGTLGGNQPILFNLGAGNSYGGLYAGTSGAIDVNTLSKNSFNSTSSLSLWGQVTYRVA